MDQEGLMTNAEWEVIEEFYSPAEYTKFAEWIGEQVTRGCAIEMPVGERYAGEYFDERWFLCKETGVMWRLVKPQAPFYGYFGPVG
jgi:hypothetical protein